MGYSHKQLDLLQTKKTINKKDDPKGIVELHLSSFSPLILLCHLSSLPLPSPLSPFCLDVPLICPYPLECLTFTLFDCFVCYFLCSFFGVLKNEHIFEGSSVITVYVRACAAYVYADVCGVREQVRAYPKL